MADHKIVVGSMFFDPEELIVSSGDRIIFEPEEEGHTILTARTEGEDISVKPEALPPWVPVKVEGTDGTWFFVCGEHPLQHEGQVSLSSADTEVSPPDSDDTPLTAPQAGGLGTRRPA
jgi:plastocyanin